VIIMMTGASVLLSFAAMLMVAHGSETVVLLNNDPAATKGGAEKGDTCLASAFGGDVQHNGGRAPADETLAEYSFEPQKDGCYAIEEYHPAVGCAGLKPGMAPVRIDYCKGEVAMGIVDQGQNGGQWNYIAKLPFYVGHKGKISVTRQDFPAEVCPTNDCLYMADAFRLTWISEKCNYAHKGHSVREELEREEAERSRHVAQTEREQMRKQAEAARAAGASATSAAEKEKALEQPVVSVRMVVEEFKAAPKKEGAEADQNDDHVMFPFQAPLDGCYVLEERHPHRPEEKSKKPVPFQVNYCKGRSAQAAVHHADGRHGQWNYLAHFPYFDDEKNAGVLVPRRVLQEKNAHAFRYTYVGPRCSAEEAEVHKMELRTTVDFKAVENRIPEFKEKLRQILASPAGVAMERILVSHVRAGSVISEVTLLPAAVHAPGIEPSSKHSAGEAVLALEKALETDLGEKICALTAADPAATCTTKVIAKGLARPLLVETEEQQQEQQSQQESASSVEKASEETGAGLEVMATSLAACGFLATALGAFLVSRRCKKNNNGTPQETEKKEVPEVPASPTVVVGKLGEKVEPFGDGIPDDTSTITPKDIDDLEKASNIASEPSEAV